MPRHKKRAQSGKQKEDVWRYDVVTEADMKNDMLDKYYLAQDAVFPGGREEWEQVLATLRKPLPTTWRINDSDAAACKTAADAVAAIAEQITAVGGDAALVPRPVDWYPAERACWQVDSGKRALVKAPATQKLHDWLVAETEAGRISRQELVSMVPPLFLNLRSDHAVLDACAAPGSKTAQIMEQLSAAAAREGAPSVSGFIVANDMDAKRCEVLVRQTMRLRDLYPNMLVTNHNAAHFPMLFEAQGQRRQFDRILCDVVCSGDGTMRKSVDLWRRWSPQMGVGVHKAQVTILRRCMELLKVGGRLVYSTCSMNPVEDEAVLAHCITTSRHKIRLVDVSTELPKLKRCAGVSRWRVMDRQGDLWEAYDDVPKDRAQKEGLVPSMFPLSAEDMERIGIRHSMRFLPHLQDTGGFFVAVLEKEEEGAPSRAPRPFRRAPRPQQAAASAEEGAATADSGSPPGGAPEAPPPQQAAAAEPAAAAAGRGAGGAGEAPAGGGDDEGSSSREEVNEPAAGAADAGVAVRRPWGDVAREGEAGERALSLTFLPLPAAETACVSQPLELTADFPTAQLVHRATARARQWRVMLVAPVVRRLIDDVNRHPSGGGWPRLKIVSTGLRLGDVAWGGQGGEPYFRPAQEAATAFVRYAAPSRLRWVTQGLLRDMLGSSQARGPWELTLRSDNPEHAGLLEGAPEGYNLLAVREGAGPGARVAPPPGVRPAAVAVVHKRGALMSLRCDLVEADRLRCLLGIALAPRKTGPRGQQGAAPRGTDADTGADADADDAEPPPKRFRDEVTGAAAAAPAVDGADGSDADADRPAPTGAAAPAAQ